MVPAFVVVHHSLTKDGEVKNWDAIRNYHKSLGWQDIGYHFGIEYIGTDLTLQVGRMPSEAGAHTKELMMNTQSIGLCVVGDFDKAPPNLALLDFTADVCKSLCQNFDIPVENILGHREVGLLAGYNWQVIGSTGIRQYKSCPGQFFPMDGLRQLVKMKLYNTSIAGVWT